MAARPSYVVKDANIRLTVPGGWSHTTIAISRQKYQHLVTLHNSLYSKSKTLLRSSWNKTGEAMKDFRSEATSAAMGAHAQEAIIDFNFYYSTTKIPKDNIPSLQDDQHRSHALQVIDFKKPANAPKFIPDYMTLLIFVEDAHANHQPDTSFDDMIVVINLVYSPEVDLNDDPDNSLSETQTTVNPDANSEARAAEATRTAEQEAGNAQRQRDQQVAEDKQKADAVAAAAAEAKQKADASMAEAAKQQADAAAAAAEVEAKARQDARSIQSGGTYRITNVKGGTVLDLAGYDNRSIIGWPSHGGPNQQWVLHNTGDLRWTFRSVSSGHYLGLDGNAADGTRLVTVSFPVEWGVLDQAHNYGGDPSLCIILVLATTQVVELSNNGDPAHGTLVTTRNLFVE